MKKNKSYEDQRQELYASLLQGAIRSRAGNILPAEMSRIADWLLDLVNALAAATAASEGLVTIHFDEGDTEPSFGLVDDDMLDAQEEDLREWD